MKTLEEFEARNYLRDKILEIALGILKAQPDSHPAELISRAGALFRQAEAEAKIGAFDSIDCCWCGIRPYTTFVGQDRVCTECYETDHQDSPGMDGAA